MDYKEKYEQAIGALRSLIAEQAIKHCDRVNIKDITNIFPELKESEDKKPNGAVVMEDFNEGNGFYKVNLAYLNKEQVEDIEKIVKRWNTIKYDEEAIRACIGIILTDAPEQRFVDFNTSLKDCLAWLEKQGDQKPADLPKGEDYGIDGLYAAIDILQKTLGKVDGYQSDDGMLEHKCAISAVKELSKQQNPAWSEEDKENFKHLMDEIVCLGNSRNSAKRLYYDKLIKFLDELKNRAQPKEKWCDKDERMLDRLIAYFEKQVAFTDEDNPRYANWLKSLRPQNTWKPSDKQMNALDSTLQYSKVPHNSFEYLNLLFNDLKKLREE